MKRQQLEHIIRAATAITGADEIVIIGSQAVLGQFPDAPAELLVSIEADVFTLRNESDSELIDGSIGEATVFHQTFGYYAHGVAADTAHLPAGWQSRLIRIENENTGTGAGLCLEINDLAVSKLIAGREKDMQFIEALFRHRLAEPAVVSTRLETISLDEQRLALSRARLARFLRA
jgi:hypothetical protein